MPMLPQSRYRENKSGRRTLPLKGIKYDVWQESKSLIERRQNWSLTWGPLLDCHLPMNPLPPKHSLCPLPHFSFRQLVRGTSYFIQILEITTQPHWTTEWHSKITCSLPPYLFCACSTRKESSGLRKEATDEENISDKGTYRIEILKEKNEKVKQENVRFKVGRRKDLFFIFISEKAILIKPMGEPNSLSRPKC